MHPPEGRVLATCSSKKSRFTTGEIHDSSKETISQSDLLHMNPLVKVAIKELGDTLENVLLSPA